MQGEEEVSTLVELRAGDLMFGPIGGVVPGMFPVGAGQLLLADRKARMTWRRWRKIRHAGVVVQTAAAPDVFNYSPRLVQAMPKGAEEITLRPDQHWTDRYVYIRPAWPHPEMAYAVADYARDYVGTPYNFLTYGALAARKLRFMLSERLLRKWISTRKDMMCSQLVDQCLTDAGFHVFDDGRLPQDVVPAELFRRLLELPGQFIIPGQTGWMDNSVWHERGKPKY
jgi:hypothetical protein